MSSRIHSYKEKMLRTKSIVQAFVLVGTLLGFFGLRSEKNPINLFGVPNAYTSKKDECVLERLLGEKHQFKPYGLLSFPGSGNTWTRDLLEDLSGYYTGSIYE